QAGERRAVGAMGEMTIHELALERRELRVGPGAQTRPRALARGSGGAGKNRFQQVRILGRCRSERLDEIAARGAFCEVERHEVALLPGEGSIEEPGSVFEYAIAAHLGLNSRFFRTKGRASE